MKKRAGSPLLEISVDDGVGKEHREKGSECFKVESSTDLEALRESNIMRNAAFLSSLGLSEDKSAIERHSLQTTSKSNSSSSARNTKKRMKIEVDDANNELDAPQATRRSSRIRGSSADAGLFNELENGENEFTASGKKLKAEKSNVDFDFENNFDEDPDEEYAKRERITPTSLRDFIDSTNTDHSETISDEQVSHCVFRLQTMSSKRLATRIKMIARAAGKHSNEKLLVFYYGLQLSNLGKLAEIVKDALNGIGVTV